MPIAVRVNEQRPRVFSLDPLQSEALALAQKHFDLVLPGDAEHEKWKQDADGLLVIGSKVDTKTFEEVGPRLRFISKQGTGVDKIDTAAAKSKGIPVMNTPGVNAQAVAELAFGLIVSLARQTASIDRKIRAGQVVTKKIGWTGQTLQGKTIGVIGGGNIGLLVAKMFQRAYDGTVVLYDPYLRSLVAWHAVIAPEYVTLVTDLNDLLRESDVVTVHVPLTPSTTDMLAAPQFKLMKPTSILINTSRGGIVNEKDVLDALNEGKIFAAGLDAFVNEPPTRDQYPGLCESDNVILTPHIGAACQSVQQATCLAMVQNLVDAFRGDVKNRVN